MEPVTPEHLSGVEPHYLAKTYNRSFYKTIIPDKDYAWSSPTLPLPAGIRPEGCFHLCAHNQLRDSGSCQLPFSDASARVELAVPKSKSGVLPLHYKAICLGSRIRTYNLPRPRRVNNRRYLPRCALFSRKRKTHETVRFWRFSSKDFGGVATVLFVEVVGFEPTRY